MRLSISLGARPLSGLLATLVACVDDEMARHGAVETHAVVDGSRDPLVAPVGRLLRVRCVAFDRDGFVAPSAGMEPTLHSGIGLGRLRREGWLELLAPGRLEVACEASGAVARTTTVMVSAGAGGSTRLDHSALTLPSLAR